MDDVEPRDQDVTGELPAEEEELDVGADDGDRADDAVGDPQPGAREQVVGQRVAGEALEDAQHEQSETDQPVELAGLAERAGEEHPQHVDRHRREEEVGGPVVHLPHQQATTDVERDVDRGLVGLGHLDVAEVGVRAVVGDLGHARVEPERQEDAGEQQDHEAPQRDLAEQEGPVVREHLAQLLLGEAGQSHALVEPRDGSATLGLAAGPGSGAVAHGHLPSFPVAWSDRFVEVAQRDEVALGVQPDRQLRERPGGRAEDRPCRCARGRRSTGGTGTADGGSAAPRG